MSEHDAAERMGEMVGHIMAPVFFIAIGVAVGYWLGRKRDPQRIVWWPVAVAALLALFGIVGSLSRSGGQPEPQAEVHAEAVPTGQSLDYDASLKALKDAVTAGLTKAYPAEVGDIAVAGEIGSVSGQRLIHVTGRKGKVLRQSVLEGVYNGQLVTVDCLSQDDLVPARFSDTRCGKAAEKALGLFGLDPSI